jgi:hypothetical protein
VCVAKSLLPKVEAQPGNLLLLAVIDSSLARSLTSYEHFRRVPHVNPRPDLASVQVSCVTYSGQYLHIAGEAVLSTKHCCLGTCIEPTSVLTGT